MAEIYRKNQDKYCWMQCYQDFAIIFWYRHFHIIKMHLEHCKWGLSLMDTDLSWGNIKTYIRFMKWSCHMVGAPILKYKRPRNTFSTARDTISCVSMKTIYLSDTISMSSFKVSYSCAPKTTTIWLSNTPNVTEVLIQGLILILYSHVLAMKLAFYLWHLLKYKLIINCIDT